MLNKKVLLINPPFYRLMKSHFNGLSLGLAYITAILEKAGFNAKIYNADYLDKEDYPKQEELFQNYQSYKEILNDEGADIWEEVKRKIKDFNPDVLGIFMYTGAYKSAKIIARLAKSMNPELKVVVGGPHPTLAPEETIKNEEFDFLIRGEGEFTFLELMEGKYFYNIKGLSYKKGGKIFHNQPREFIQDLDSLPFPARNLLLEKGKNLDLGYVITGRGCPFNCAFCASPKIWQRKVRLRSVDNVIAELEELVKKYQIRKINFVDDTFTLNKERTKEICRKIIEKGLNIKWRCDTRANCLDEELVSLMKKSGCVRARIGAESGSNKVLKLMQKYQTKEDVRKGAALIKKYGIGLTVYFMAGFPGENNDDLKETIEFAKELKADYYSLGIVSPYYGTDVYFKLLNQGKIGKSESWEYFYHQSLEPVGNTNLDPKIIEEFLSISKLYAWDKRI